jgi:hypothetical protein
MRGIKMMDAGEARGGRDVRNRTVRIVIAATTLTASMLVCAAPAAAQAATAGQRTATLCVAIDRQAPVGATTRTAAGGAGCRRGEVLMHVVSETSRPFFADPPESREGFVATLLGATDAIRVATPLLLRLELQVSADRQMDSAQATGTTGAVPPPASITCVPRVDGRSATRWPPVRPAAVTAAADGADPAAAPSDVTGEDRNPPAPPDLLLAAWFTSPAVPSGTHRFSVTCKSVRPFRITGDVSLTVLQQPGRF